MKDTKRKIEQPCPFCGSRKTYVTSDYSGRYWVRCERCEATGPPESLQLMAIASWDWRPSPEPPPPPPPPENICESEHK